MTDGWPQVPNKLMDVYDQKQSIYKVKYVVFVIKLLKQA